MKRLIGQRLLWVIPTLLIVSFFVFLLLDLAPGDPARAVAGADATPAQILQVRKELRLDDPLLTRYWRWISSAAHGDLGNSIKGGESVAKLVFEVLPPTLSLVGLSLVFSLIGAVFLGTAPSLFPNAIVARTCAFLSAVAIAMPSFFIALLLVGAFAIDRSWLPAVGYVKFATDPWEWFRHLLLPAIALSGLTAGDLARQLHGSMSDVIQRDYVTTLRAKGIPTHVIVLKHGLKNAAVPVITVLGVRIAQLIGGTVLVEQVFSFDGLGTLTFNAVLARDIPVVLGVVLITTTLVLLINLLADLSYPYFNPRVRES